MLSHYIKSFFSSIRKNRFFYSINLFGFLTGFLLLTIIFTFVYQELSFDNFHTRSGNIYRIHCCGYGVTPMCFAEKLKNQVPEINNAVRFSSTDLTIVHNNNEFKLNGCYYTDQDVFQVFSFKLFSGDVATTLKNPFSIVIDKSTAEKLFGTGSPIGETIRDKDGTTYTVTGIMDDIPYNSHIRASAFISVETLRKTGDNKTFNCGSWSILTYVCLSENSNFKDTEGKINTILEDSRMSSNEGKILLKLQPLKKIYFDYSNNKYDGSRHGNRQTVAIYLAISILILIIVIINYINLTTFISGSRIKEFAIRKVNGANQIEIIKQFMFEALSLVFFSFIIALVIIELLLPWLSKLLNLSISEQLNRSQLYFFYFLGITVIGILSGLMPGIFLSKVNESKALKNESFIKSKGIIRKLLLVFQLIIVAVLLNSMFIVNRQIGYVLGKNLGFNSENVVCIQLDKNLSEKTELLKQNLLQNPEIQHVSFSGGLIGDGFSKTPAKIDSTENLCYFYSIDPDYLELLQLKLKYGRNFSWDFPTDFSNSCLVNEVACKEFGIENPVNKTIGSRTIVGVVYDFNFTSLHNRIEPLILNCGIDGKTVQIKLAESNQEKTINFIKNSCKNISPGFDFNHSFLDNRMKQLYKSELDLKRSFVIYAVVTFLIALLGLFGLTLFTIRKKMKEAGIRKLYGAKLSDTFKLFTEEQILIVAISNLLAVPVSYWIMNRWLSNFQYRVTIDVLVFAETFLITLVFTLMAITFLIVKTHKSNLIETLKHE